MGNLAQVQVFTISSHKSGNGEEKRSFKVREKSGNFILSQRRFMFSREVREKIFFTNSSN